MNQPSRLSTQPIPIDLRQRILDAAAKLIANGGREAATTRAVAAAASVQPPAIYRLFGDKTGLLDAVAEHAMAIYAAEKASSERHPDPAIDLRNGWETHIAFGLANPEIFAIMAGVTQPGQYSPATVAGLEVLRGRIRRLAEAGRLATSEERATSLMHASATGTILTLLGQPEGNRDMGLSETARDSVLATITGKAMLEGRDGEAPAASVLRASLDSFKNLSPGERHLLDELLRRIADATP